MLTCGCVIMTVVSLRKIQFGAFTVFHFFPFIKIAVFQSSICKIVVVLFAFCYQIQFHRMLWFLRTNSLLQAFTPALNANRPTVICILTFPFF